VGKRKVKVKLTALAKAKAAQAMELDNWGFSFAIFRNVLNLMDDSVVLRSKNTVFYSVLGRYTYNYGGVRCILFDKLYYNIIVSLLQFFLPINCLLLLLHLLIDWYDFVLVSSLCCARCLYSMSVLQVICWDEESLAFCFHDEVLYFLWAMNYVYG